MLPANWISTSLSLHHEAYIRNNRCNVFITYSPTKVTSPCSKHSQNCKTPHCKLAIYTVKYC